MAGRDLFADEAQPQQPVSGGRDLFASEPAIQAPIQQQPIQPVAAPRPSMAEMLDKYRSGGMNPSQSSAFMELMSRNFKAPAPAAPTETRGFGDAQQLVEGRSMTDLLEPVATLATGIAAEPISGLAGIVNPANPFGPETAAEAVESTREALTYMPRTEGGQEALANVGEVLEPVGKVVSALETGLGDFAFNLTGSPTIAAAAASSPTIITELLGLRGLKSLRTGTKLVDEAGNATKVLRKELNKKGLDYYTLQPEVKDLVPSEVGPDLFPRAKSPVRREVEDALARQIEAGGREDALATLKVEGGRVKTDKLGAEAVKQGFRPGFVQSIKTANAATKSKMLKMVRTMRQIKKSESVGVRIRPDDIVGESITERIGFIRDKANDARKELDDIAKNQLSGQDIDTAAVVDNLQNELYELDVRTRTGKNGLPEPVFDGSLIMEDGSAQSTIKSVFRLLAYGEKPDALRLHKLKRQLDTMINYKKTGSEGLSNAGENFVKSIRRSLNDTLRPANNDYARVNDVLSSVLGSIDDLDRSVGSIDILGRGSEKALGTRMRALLSNQQGRVSIENALDQINETTKSLGGVFNDDIKDLVMFSDGLNSRFGTTAKTSLAGQVEQAVGSAVTKPPRASVVEAVGRGVGKGAEKLKGINEFNSFEALESLLK